MKKWIAIVCCVIVLAYCLVGCSSAPDIAEPLLESTAPTEDTQDDEITVYPADMDVFYNLESFLEFATTAQSGDGNADLASLEYFWLPTELPEGYTLCKINAGIMDIGFTYLPAEAAAQEGAARLAETYKEHIKLISPRGYYVFESIMDQFDVTAEDLIDGKYILHEYAEKVMVVWEEDENVMMLYLPRQFVFEQWEAMCSRQKYVRTDDNTFQKTED